jgi:hypothetical protein
MKPPLKMKHTRPITAAFLKKNPDYLEEFEEDWRKINSYDSEQFFEWLETASPTAIENFRVFSEYKNPPRDKSNGFLRLCKKILNFCGTSIVFVFGEIWDILEFLWESFFSKVLIALGITLGVAGVFGGFYLFLAFVFVPLIKFNIFTGIGFAVFLFTLFFVFTANPY